MWRKKHKWEKKIEKLKIGVGEVNIPVSTTDCKIDRKSSEYIETHIKDLFKHKYQENRYILGN